MAWWQWLLVVTGGVILALLILIGIAVTYVKSKWKGFTEGLAEAFKGLGGSTIPQTLEMEPIDVDLDAEYPALAEAKREAEGLGVQVAGPFSAGHESAGGPIVSLTMADPDRSFAGLMFQHPDGTAIKDLLTWYEDDTTITHSTMVPKLDSPPQRVRIGIEGVNLAELIERHLAERPEGPMKPAALDTVPIESKRYTEEQWFWQATRGGLTDDEIEQQIRDANAADPEADSNDPLAGLDMMKVMIRSQARSFLEERLEKKHRDETTLSVAEWEEIEHRLLWVHEWSDPERLAWAVMPEAEREAEDESEDDEPGPTQAALSAGPIRETFARLNEALPAERQLRLLETVHITDTLASYEGDVYVEPESDDDDDYDDE